MKSTTRFLLGGVLGVVVGYLLAQRSGKVPAAGLAEQAVSPEILEEPLPGFGWEPVSVPEDEGTTEQAAGEEEAAVGDLRARIEATRRRIREELEQPFVPLVVERSTPERTASESTEGSLELTLDDVCESPRERVDVDLEAVRRQIEEVRSRLKAKTFDAMMSGEAALLGRDPGGAAERKRLAAPVVDAEIDKTIETALREEQL